VLTRIRVADTDSNTVNNSKNSDKRRPQV